MEEPPKAVPDQIAKKTLYVESTIPSLATGRPSRDIITAGHQATTRLFWETERQKYDLFISQYVIDECSLGDPDAAKRRIDFLKGIPSLGQSEKVDELAAVYQTLLQIPDRARTDCFHLAVCVIEEINFLLTWNCNHLGANSYLKIREYNGGRHLWTPLLVTPDALMEIKEEEYL
jgi:hypothetical protein